MPSRVVVSAITFIMLIAFLVFAVEFFIPLSIKSDMNSFCRNALLQMEIEGGFKSDNRDELISKMEQRGFINIIAEGTDQSKQGERLELKVEADYRFNKLKGLFVRSEVTQRMVYKKTSTARKVIN